MIDAHHHFWNYNPDEYGWIGDNMRALRRDFLPGDLEPLLRRHGVTGTVAVQARASLAETEWLLSLASRHPFILGTVGWVDLCDFNVGEHLERFAQHPAFKGVRHVLQDEPDDGYMLRGDFQNGLRLLERHGLTYDLLIFPRHLPFAVELADRFPNQRFILDHIAKPDIRGGDVQLWARWIRELAHRENVWCKVSGMVTEADWHRWKPSDFTPCLDTVFEAFGTRRLAIGSDWPVCLAAAPYGGVIGLVKDYMAMRGVADDDRADVLENNARRFYGL